MQERTAISDDKLYREAYELDRRGKTAEAIDKYQQVLIARPEHLYARMRLAYIYSRLGGYVSMKKELKIAQKLDPCAAMVYDEVFFGSETFLEYEAYRKRTFKTRYKWEKTLEEGWYISRIYVKDHVFLILESREGHYQPGCSPDVEVLAYKRSENAPEYLIKRRKCRDGNLYNFMCRFSDGKAFRTQDINNSSDGSEIFASYAVTFEKELETVFS